MIERVISSVETIGRRRSGRAYGIFFIAFLLFVVVLAILSHLGLPDGAIGTLFIFVIGAVALIGAVLGRTMQLGEFFLANRDVSAPNNGMATAAAFLSGMATLGLAGAYFADGGTALAALVGWVGGFALLTILVAPAFRRSEAATLAEFLGLHFDSRPILLAAALITVAVSIAALAVAIDAAGLAVTQLVALPEREAVILALVLVLVPAIFGGMRAVTLTSVAFYIVLAVAFVVPAAIISYRDYSLPVPPLTYGFALQSVAEAVARTGSTLAAGPAGHFLPPLPEGGFNLVALALTFAAGVASLPHLVMRAGTTVGAHSTRRSLAWALFFVLVILMTAPAYGAYAKLALFKLVASQGTGGLPGWVYDFGQAGLVRICGVNAVDPETVRRACDAAAGGVLLPSDIAVGADAIALGLPAIADLPPIMTGLVAAGILAAALSAAQALLLALANTAGHDLCFKLLAPHASVGRRLVITRLVMIVTGLVALWLARASQDWLFAFAAASLALAASAYFPILVLGIWWRGCTRLGALAGMVAGFAVAAGYTGLVHFTGMPLWPVVGPSAGGLPTMAAGIIGMPAAVLVAVGVSLLQPITARQDDDLA